MDVSVPDNFNIPGIKVSVQNYKDMKIKKIVVLVTELYEDVVVVKIDDFIVEKEVVVIEENKRKSKNRNNFKT